MSGQHGPGSQPPGDGKKFLNMSAGLLALAIAGLLLLPLLCCGACLVTGILGQLTGQPTPSPTP